LTCSTCRLGLKTIDNVLTSESGINRLEAFAVGVCLNYVTTIEEVCNGAVKEMGDILLPVLAESFLSADYFCAEVLSLCSFPTYTKFYAKDYVSAMTATKPDMIQDNNYLNNLYDFIKSDTNPRRTLKAVHISDPHIDFLYSPGSNANCGNFICCRSETGLPADPKDAAGIWGDYACDIPHNVLTSMLEYVRDTVKPDMFIWTGDNSAHNVWNNTNDEVTAYVVNITETIKDIFADTTITVFPI